MSIRRTGSFAIAALLLASGGAQAQTGKYYLAAGDQGTNSVAQGGSLLFNFAQANPSNGGEYAIAVSGDVRTLGNGNTCSGLGSQYTLGGVYTGTNYSCPAQNAFYDGTTNGVNYNYSVDYFTGNVWQMDRSWGSASLLFATGQISELGITFDPGTNTLWTANYSSGLVSNWTLGGSLLSSWSSGLFSVGSLALDYTDGTMWMTSQSNNGALYQFGVDGTPLGGGNTGTGFNYLGGEFEVNAVVATPEPASLLLLGTGLLIVVPAARRRFRHA